MSTQNEIDIIAFYRFVPLPDFKELKEPLKKYCLSQDIKGTIILAKEGINGTISGTKEALNNVWQYLAKDKRLKNIPFKVSHAKYKPFGKMKVRLKKEIVRMGLEEMPVDNPGEYVSGEEWDKLISDEDTLVVDTRNKYEVMLGSFKNAINPETDEFRQFPEWVEQNLDPKKHKKVAMFCTGGIRCEKSTALLKRKGFDEVYHLDGGILQYLEDTKNKNKMWQGECFVFDDRIAVDDNLKPSKDLKCKVCGVDIKMDEIRWGKNNRGVRCAKCENLD